MKNVKYRFIAVRIFDVYITQKYTQIYCQMERLFYEGKNKGKN